MEVPILWCVLLRARMFSFLYFDSQNRFAAKEQFVDFSILIELEPKMKSVSFPCVFRNIILGGWCNPGSPHKLQSQHQISKISSLVFPQIGGLLLAKEQETSTEQETSKNQETITSTPRTADTALRCCPHLNVSLTYEGPDTHSDGWPRHIVPLLHSTSVLMLIDSYCDTLHHILHN